MTQDELKKQVAIAAMEYVQENTIIGVGTGSTANFFIDELATVKDSIIGTVASSKATHERLESHGIKVFDLNEVESMSVYVDGADEINHNLQMIKGGGGALTREKIVASNADSFVCIADSSKLVQTLGAFALPVEVIPMATQGIIRKIHATLGAQSSIRDFTTDNGNNIIDISGLSIENPYQLEQIINNIPGVVTNGIFALNPATTLLLGTEQGVRTLTNHTTAL